MHTNVKLLLAVILFTATSMKTPRYFSQHLPEVTVGTDPVNDTTLAINDLKEKTVLHISGRVQSLVVKATKGKSIETNVNDYSVSELSIDDEKLSLKLKNHEANIVVKVPKGIKVVCDMEGIQYTKGDLYLREDNDDYRNVSFIGLTGDVKFEGDGYHVKAEKHGGSLDILTYGNVYASLSDLPKGEKIDIDSYLGNVTVKVDPMINANLNLTTKKGKVVLNHLYRVLPKKYGKKKFIGLLNDGGPEIKLHSENGKMVMLSSKMKLK